MFHIILYYMILYVLYMLLRKPRSTLERLGTSNAERLACGWIKGSSPSKYSSMCCKNGYFQSREPFPCSFRRRVETFIGKSLGDHPSEPQKPQRNVTSFESSRRKTSWEETIRHISHITPYCNRTVMWSGNSNRSSLAPHWKILDIWMPKKLRTAPSHDWDQDPQNWE